MEGNLQDMLVKEIVERKSLDDIIKFSDYVDNIKRKKVIRFIKDSFHFLDIQHIGKIKFQNSMIYRINFSFYHNERIYDITIYPGMDIQFEITLKTPKEITIVYGEEHYEGECEYDLGIHHEYVKDNYYKQLGIAIVNALLDKKNQYIEHYVQINDEWSNYIVGVLDCVIFRFDIEQKK